VPTYFEQLEANIVGIENLPQNANAIGFFVQEVIRFYSIAGTLLKNGFTLDASSSVSERHLTHILTRSLLENYFTIIYIFDDLSQTAARYEKLKNSFKDEYRKLMNDLNSPSWQSFMQTHQGRLEPASLAWIRDQGLPDVNTMLTGLLNDYGDRLNYLYPIYRISSFDTHGRSMGAIFEAVFGKKCNFPVLQIEYVFELMANQYLVMLNNLRASGVV